MEGRSVRRRRYLFRIARMPPRRRTLRNAVMSSLLGALPFFVQFDSGTAGRSPFTNYASVEQPERGPRDAFEQGPLRPGAGEDPNAEHNAE
jgi:hypothetical protein